MKTLKNCIFTAFILPSDLKLILSNVSIAAGFQSKNFCTGNIAFTLIDYVILIFILNVKPYKSKLTNKIFQLFLYFLVKLFFFNFIKNISMYLSYSQITTNF